MTPEQKSYLQTVLTNIKTDRIAYLFNDYINLVKLHNYLLESSEFVSLMFIQGRKEALLKLDTAKDVFARNIEFFKQDLEFAQYASRLHFLIMVI